MKRLLLAATLCLAASVVAPITSASAAFKGQCGTGALEKIGGRATFTKGLLSETEAVHGYEFTGEKGECEEEGTKTKRKVEKVTVKGGEFKGTCLGKGTATKDGEGKLKLSGLAELGFDLDFESEKGVVHLKLEKAGEAAPEKEPPPAKGTATFFKSIKKLAVECILVGVNELEFEAEAEGEIG